ncbi:MAG: type I-E CRISPR-associated protein Cas5/CasD [Planctomycetota bacterium]|nr:type I-E CRISPR-associated protein Cas5/CasD [Planctomycetota bacterium]
MPEPHTLFLRLEGPLQAWGDTSKFVIRRTMEAPTKSGVLGLLACAMGVTRDKQAEEFKRLNALRMGVRIDRPGTRWWDYHTVGARIGLTTAAGGVKTGAQGTLITRREYLADASFLVALQGDEALVREVASALSKPVWPLFLGRKSCTPSVPVLVLHKLEEGKFEPRIEQGISLEDALKCIPWQPRFKSLDKPPKELACILEWRATAAQPEAPGDAEVWYDLPVAYTGVAPVHQARFVTRCTLTVGENGVPVPLDNKNKPIPLLTSVSRPSRPRANYTSNEWKDKRRQRLARDHGLCVFCKAPANTVQHITYRNAGGSEVVEKELASLCRLCHDACTMLEYGEGMTMDRIDPTHPKWRDQIIAKRDEIRKFRSVEGRRRALARAPERDKKALEELDEEE